MRHYLPQQISEEIQEPSGIPGQILSCPCPRATHLGEGGPRKRAMASMAGSELSPALLKVATHVYRFPLPATKLIAFTKCFADNLGAEETSKSIRSVYRVITAVCCEAVEVFLGRLHSFTACPVRCWRISLVASNLVGLTRQAPALFSPALCAVYRCDAKAENQSTEPSSGCGLPIVNPFTKTQPGCV